MEITKEQAKAIKEALWDYHWIIKQTNGKNNLYMDNLAFAFPDLNQQALKEVGHYKNN